jgi:hypothetical protein
MVVAQPGFSSSLQLSLLGFRRAFITDNRITGDPYDFLQQSDLKKHLSTKSGNITNHKEAPRTEAPPVILRDGNLVTLPPSNLEDATGIKRQ